MTDLYRMAEPAHNMDADFTHNLQVCSVRIVDMSQAPHNVIFEGEKDELESLYRNCFGDDDNPPNILPAAEMPCACVETVHRVRVDFECKAWRALAPIEAELFRLADAAGAAQAQARSGNAACAPYFFCEHTDLQAAHVLGRTLVDFLLKQGCKVTS